MITKTAGDKLYPESLPAIIGVVRLLLIKKTDSNMWDNIEELMDHGEDRRHNVGEWKMFQKTVVEPVIDALGEELETSETEIQAILGRLNVNSVSFRFSGDQGSDHVEGRGLYPTLSLVSRNCVANSRYQGYKLLSQIFPH